MNFHSGNGIISGVRAVLLLLFFCTSCGYRLGHGELVEHYKSICVPYAQGDDHGELTTALIRQITTKSPLSYCSSGSDLSLKVCLEAPEDTNIGFAYAPKDNDSKKFTKIVVSNEARLSMTATISLIDRCTGCCILGPCSITSSITYDFEPDLSNIDSHAFSLGQLEMRPLAEDAATTPLYELLAQKIVDYITHCWYE